MKNMSQKFSRFLQSRIFWIQTISISLIALCLVVGFSYAWGTSDNTSAPLKIGIGITTPHRLLHLYQDSGNNAELDIQSVAGMNNHWAIYNDRDKNQLRFWQGDDRLTITNDGKVGIGTAEPKTELDVNGTIKAKPPVDSNDVATKGYVDAASGGGASRSVPIVFFTKARYTGNMGGLAGVDAKCATEVPGAKMIRSSLAISDDWIFYNYDGGSSSKSGWIDYSNGWADSRCHGWTSNSNVYTSRVVYSKDITMDGGVLKIPSGNNRSCAEPHPILCIKY